MVVDSELLRNERTSPPSSRSAHRTSEVVFDPAKCPSPLYGYREEAAVEDMPQPVAEPQPAASSSAPGQIETPIGEVELVIGEGFIPASGAEQSAAHVPGEDMRGNGGGAGGMQVRPKRGSTRRPDVHPDVWGKMSDNETAGLCGIRGEVALRTGHRRGIAHLHTSSLWGYGRIHAYSARREKVHHSPQRRSAVSWSAML